MKSICPPTPNLKKKVGYDEDELRYIKCQLDGNDTLKEGDDGEDESKFATMNHRDRMLARKRVKQRKKEERERAELLNIRKEYFRERQALANKVLARSEFVDEYASEYMSSRNTTAEEGAAASKVSSEEGAAASKVSGGDNPSAHSAPSARDQMLRRKEERKREEEKQRKAALLETRKSYFALRKRLHELQYVPAALVVAWTQRSAEVPARFAASSSASSKTSQDDSAAMMMMTPVTVKGTGTAGRGSSKLDDDEPEAAGSGGSSKVSDSSRPVDEEYMTASTMASSGSFKMSKKCLLKAHRRKSGSKRKEAEDTASNAPLNPAVSLEILGQRWFEVTCLLRHAFVGRQEYDKGVSRVHSSLEFLQRLDRTASREKFNTGHIFQELLRRLGSSGAAAVVVGRGEGAYDAYAEGIASASISAVEWEALTKGAAGVLALVRIKLEDKNDLKTARSALEHSSRFFGHIKEQ